MIAQLRQSLRTLEKPAGIDGEAGYLPLGIAAVDADARRRPGARRAARDRGAKRGPSRRGDGFALGLVSFSPSWPGLSRPSTSFPRQGIQDVDARHKAGHDGRGSSLAWIAEDMALAESGALYGPGLDAFALAPERLLTVGVAHRRDLLWAMEEALRCRAVAAVIGEWRHGAIDMVATRRLSLAAAESGALALLLRAVPADEASTAATRWIVGASPSLGGR